MLHMKLIDFSGVQRTNGEQKTRCFDKKFWRQTGWRDVYGIDVLFLFFFEAFWTTGLVQDLF